MDGNRQTAARTVLICVADEFDKNERQKQRGQEIEGAVLIARDAVIGTRLLARQFQIDLIMAGNGANVRILEHLQPRPIMTPPRTLSDDCRKMLYGALAGCPSGSASNSSFSSFSEQLTSS